MEQKIIYNGETRALSNLDCPDGDLSLSFNMISENGSLRPIILPDTEFTMGSGETLLYIHSTSEYKNYIYQTGNTLKAFTFDKDGIRTTISFNYPLTGELRQIQSIGNTLIILESTQMQYLLFKKGTYEILGQKPPETNISFGLTGDIVEHEKFYVDIQDEKGVLDDTVGAALTKLSEEFNDDNKKTVFNALAGHINKFIAEETREKGRFIYPFFIRYAYRMYDGSLSMHSAPILITPTTDVAPRVRIRETNRNSSGTRLIYGFDSSVWAFVCDLDYYISSNNISLDNWSDVITSIDFFISSPIFTYDQNATEVERITFVKDGTSSKYPQRPFVKDAYFFGNLNNPPSKTIPYKSYTRYDIYEAYALWNWKMNSDGTFTVTDGDFTDMEYVLPNTLEKLKDRIPEESLFYKVESINLSDLKYNTRQKMEMNSDRIRNLELQEVMTDDYDSHDTLIPSYLYMYNSRLNMANLSKKFFNGFVVSSMVQYLERTKYSYTGYVGTTYNYDAYVYIQDSLGSENIVYIQNINRPVTQYQFWLYYPNAGAYKIVLHQKETNLYATLSMKSHTKLNGSYYFGSFEDIKFQSGSSPEVNTAATLPNKIYTSEVNNPFYFPLSGINTVGVGQILGISSTTRALSQGQFGQFPLLVFSTDGIWAMEVSDTGLYSTKQPISRDVCSNPASITQTDGAVVFISDRGAMLVSGSEVQSFSSILDGPSFNLDSVKKLDEIATKEGLTNELNSIIPIKDFFTGCRIAYDYPNSRLFFTYKDKPYSMVYSLASGSWAKLSSNFKQIINDYPSCYIQNQDGGVLNISEKINYDGNKVSNGLVLSRPIKLGDDELKTVTEIINRGVFEKNDVAMVLFASVDGMTYFPIGSVVGPKLYRISGTPYRYFRIGLITKFNLQKSLSGTSVYFEQKARNRPR